MSKKYEFNLLLGIYKGCKVYQVVKKRKRKGFYTSFFLVMKNNKTKRIYSKSKKRELAYNFSSSLSFIALRLTQYSDSINYIGKFYNYFIWEAWKEDSFDNKAIYVFYDYKNYIVLTDREKIEEVKAYLLMQGA